MNIKIYFNRTYKNSANLINVEINCRYFTIQKNNKSKDELLIDNMVVCGKNELINSIEFYINGYKNIIEIYPDEKIYSTELNYENTKRINISQLNQFIVNNLIELEY